MRYIDSDGVAWELEQAMLFGEKSDIIAQIFGRALVKIRRDGEVGGHWLRAPADWKNDRAIAELLVEVRDFERRSK